MQLRVEDRQIDVHTLVAVSQEAVEANRKSLVPVPEHLPEVVDNGLLGQVNVAQVLDLLQLDHRLRVR